MITKQQRLALRSLAQNLQDLVYIGKDGVSENVLTQINDNLYAHELIKIKVQSSADESLKDISQKIATECGCEIVTTIGSKIVLYRPSNKPNNKER